MKTFPSLLRSLFVAVVCLSANAIFGQSVEQVDVTFRVDMRYQGISPEGVFISSSVNSWEKVPLSQINDTEWEVTLEVPINYEVLWKFLNGPDGWEQLSSEGFCAINGGINHPSRTFITPTHDVTLPTSCFGFCTACNLVGAEEEGMWENVKVYPNPASETFMLSYRFEQPVELGLALVGTTGLVVFEKNYGSVVSGNVAIDVSGVPAGSYLLILRNGSAFKTTLLALNGSK